MKRTPKDREKAPIGSAERPWTDVEIASAKIRSRIGYLVDLHFGGNIRAAATAAGIAQRTLAHLADPRSPHNPRVETVHRIANAFNVDASWLLTGQESVDPLRTPATFREQLRRLNLSPELLEAVDRLTHPVWRAATQLVADNDNSETKLLRLGYFTWLRSMQLWREFLTQAVGMYGEKRVAKWLSDHADDVRSGYMRGQWDDPRM